MEEALTPRMRLAGDLNSLAKFGDYFSGRTLEKGTAILLLYGAESALEVAVLPPGPHDYTQVPPPF